MGFEITYARAMHIGWRLGRGGGGGGGGDGGDDDEEFNEGSLLDLMKMYNSTAIRERHIYIYIFSYVNVSRPTPTVTPILRLGMCIFQSMYASASEFQK